MALLDDYGAGVAFDEMVDASGQVRPPYEALESQLARMGPDDLRAIADSLASNYIAAGVTFDVGGVERPFPLDVVPRILSSSEWDTIESGVAQRVRVLEAFLDDVYSETRCVTDGIVPRRLLSTSTHFHRAMHGIKPPNGVRVHVAGIDLILVNPGPQGFGVDSELVADTAEDAAAGTRVGFECVEDHADCSLAKLERVFLLGHDREVLSVASLSPLFPGRFTLSDLPGVATRCFSPWRRPT